MRIDRPLSGKYLYLFRRGSLQVLFYWFSIEIVEYKWKDSRYQQSLFHRNLLSDSMRFNERREEIKRKKIGEMRRENERIHDKKKDRKRKIYTYIEREREVQFTLLVEIAFPDNWTANVYAHEITFERISEPSRRYYFILII